MINIDNPFSVETPESMSAQEINDLFVPIQEYYDLNVSGHVFLHGHRGSGKSMMFRRLSPDCQSLFHNKKISELDFFGVYTSMKKTDLDLMDLSAIESPNTRAIISEHVLICFFLSKIFSEIRSHFNLSAEEEISELQCFFTNKLVPIFEDLGYSRNIDKSIYNDRKGMDLLNYIVDLFDNFYKSYVSYLKRAVTSFGQQVNYSGPLFSFYDLFLPIIEEIKTMSFMPTGPIFLLIDDVDNLNISQTKVINSWVSYRTTDILSFKLATQMNYKTLVTVSGRRIEYPHDFKEINYSSVYTGSKKDKYPEWVKAVTKKRLNFFYKKKYGLTDIDIDPETYFPFDIKQQKAVEEIGRKYKSGEILGRGYRTSDDAYRYARTDFIVSLGGNAKNSSTYKYAGFNQLVHLSSGIIRYFLDPASKMYSLQERHSKEEMFFEINPTYQNSVLRDEADNLLFSQIDNMIDECENEEIEQDSNIKLETIEKLRNLISTMGALFYSAMKSNKSERKFFSFAISDPEKMSQSLRRVLTLGVQEGYLYQSYVGTKEGMGRTKLYVLTRRLAPVFKLDPIGFSAYKFVTCKFLDESTLQPKSIINILKNKGLDGVKEKFEPKQGSLI